MKKIAIILFITIASVKVRAQTFHTYADTANYLIHQIENKKALYVGYPLSKLMDSLKIQPVRAITAAYTEQQGGFGKTISLYFNYELDNFSKKHILILNFTNVPVYSVLFPIFFTPTGPGGTRQKGSIQSILTVYRPLIVADIVVKDYMEDEPVNPDVHY